MLIVFPSAFVYKAAIMGEFQCKPIGTLMTALKGEDRFTVPFEGTLVFVPDHFISSIRGLSNNN